MVVYKNLDDSLSRYDGLVTKFWGARLTVHCQRDMVNPSDQSCETMIYGVLVRLQ